MATNTACTACMRALRLTVRQELRAQSRSAPRFQATRRAFSATRQARSPEAPKYTHSPSSDASALQSFARRMRESPQLTAATEPYVAYGATQELFKQCAEAGEYTMPPLKDGEAKKVTSKGEELGIGKGWWYQELELLPVFNTWAQITFIHMYLLTVRLRMFPADHASYWHQNLLDHFFYAAEDRMATLHNIDARSVRNKYLKDLFVQWRGVLAAYDEGLIKGDAVLAAAVWRNVFGAKEDVDVVKVAEVVAWMRRTLVELDSLTDGDVAGRKLVFPHPGNEQRLVLRESEGIKEPFGEVDQAAQPTQA